MPEGNLEKLLGGYATGTLTEEERKALFEAALHDQELFNALADEQALKELLDDPVSRRRLLDALEKASAHPAANWLTPAIDWFRRPAKLAFAGTLATAIIAVVVVVKIQRESAFGPADEFVTSDSRSLKQPKPEPQAVPEEQALLAERAGTEKTTTSRQRAEQKPPAPAPPRRIDKRTAPGRTPAGGAPRPSEPPALRKAKKEASQPAGGLVASEEDAPAAEAFDQFARAPERPQPTAESEMAQAPPAMAVKPEEAPARMRRLQASLGQPMEPGPARKLFYQPSRRESQAVRDEFEEEARSEVRGFGKSARIDSFAVEAGQPLGLRYSVLKQGGDGVFRETNPDGPFNADDVLKLTVEVNEPGHLYVFKQGPAGEWMWLFPPSRQGRRKAGMGPEVLSRRRYTIPATEDLIFTGASVENKVVVVFSREARRDFQPLLSGTEGKKDSDDAKSADVSRLLSRARAEATADPLLVQKVDAAQPGSPPEQAVYVVNRNPGPTPSLIAEFLLSTR